MTQQHNILKYWRDIEVFNLPGFNKDAVLLDLNQILPWMLDQTRAKDNYKWRYTLYFGKIGNSSIISYLNTLLKSEQIQDWQEPVTGFSCLSALILNENGSIEQDSYILASYILGIKALKSGKDLSTISEELEKVKQDFIERHNILDNSSDSHQKGDKPFCLTQIQNEIAYLSWLAPWLNSDIKVFVLKEQVYKDSEAVISFLNSFFLDDLNYLTSIKTSEFSPSLKQYLTLKPSIDKRRDLIKDKQHLFEALNPCYLTMGRWPSKIEYGLYSAQSAAVNTIFKDLKHSEGIQGVNGPPGTGKTTLLLDVIAEVVVKRALVISDLGCDHIFDQGHNVIPKENGFDLYTYPLNPKLQRDFGIVVASNNNAAVENITKELPCKSKIDNETFSKASYFSNYSQRLIHQPSWGVLAAALGNSENRTLFKQAFWESNEKENHFGFEALLYSVYKKTDNTNLYAREFEKQNQKFKSLISEFTQFQSLSSEFHDLLPKCIENQNQKDKHLSAIALIDTKIKDCVDKEKMLLNQKQELENDFSKMESTLGVLSLRKPSFLFFHKLFKTSDFTSWDAQASEILQDFNKINKQISDLKNQIDSCLKSIKDYQLEKKALGLEIEKLDEFFIYYNNIKRELNHKYGIDTNDICDLKFLDKSIKQIHLLNPYHSKKIARLRSEIFLTALKLHENAILVNAKKIRNNLNAYFQLIQNTIKTDDKIYQNLWDTFFLCVPVVSTTLASVGRLFSSYSKQQIGWLLLDEAGQATAQSVVGVIQRSKRCVVVGDPLQVEPVVTMPVELVKRLRQEYRVDIDWSYSKTSVQQLADRISRYGTYMDVSGTDKKIWTGFPLRTHRRCDDPMFRIANDIAYNGQMVKATNLTPETQSLAVSQWYNVSDQVILQDRHVVIDEIRLLKEKIFQLRSSGFNKQIYVISPFKSIARYCHNEFLYDKKIECGTIHRFQGKEADVVFLVLGGDPRSQGARNWVSQKPNMLNVALTRAKKRFYVVGNKNLWGNCDYFNVMAKELK
ncbi:ATP-binding protein [Myroides odoratimimus]|uniref:ATP-binding protein n=1 Tax=Myroides odoratimimus TaxID=76832 RepID=UPI002DBBCA68|nr:ATP-binding protein [Myroides odoratimimus]MEC4043648.1 ATP-binding protein [Myroides odoratimimus]MEC4151484.1 ATP-binding protein [Myroides odoratimimus]